MGRKAVTSNVLWNTQSIALHFENALVIHCIPVCLQPSGLVLPLDPGRQGRESEADDMRNSPSLESKSSASHDFKPFSASPSPVAIGE